MTAQERKTDGWTVYIGKKDTEFEAPSPPPPQKKKKSTYTKNDDNRASKSIREKRKMTGQEEGIKRDWTGQNTRGYI